MTPELQNTLTWLANQIAEASIHYLSDRTFAMDMQEAYEKFYKHLKEHSLIDWKNLTVEQARELRFARWEEESDLYLIPIWLYPLIPDDLELITIGGRTIKKPEDTDIRYGCLAYGLLLGGDRKPKGFATEKEVHPDDDRT